MLGGKNKHRCQPLGYTIVEVMIVLAVSGIMFLIAANFINGKQERAAFTQGSNDLGSKLQQIVADVTDGHYSDVPISCTPGSRPIGNTDGSGSQGQTSSCVFYGKIIGFYSSAGQRSNYRVFSLAAGRDVTGQPPQPKIGVIKGLSTNSVVPQSLIVKSLTVDGGDCNGDFNIGFAQSLGNATDGVYSTGAQQQVQLICAKTTADQSDVRTVETNMQGNTIVPAKSATICLTDGTRYADIFIGGVQPGQQAGSSNNNQLNISVQQLGTTACS
jgi:prepilin-type N-terminal cleavage/methylation domain-containing protein